jgi:glucuronoarabinoxylan endo-1,4-beta-xylanase
MTEVYTADVNNKGSNTWPLCLDVAYEMHRALALSNMSAYVWWYLKRNYGPLWISANNAQAAASAGQVSKVGAIMGQYSKYIRPGAVRVNATRKVQTDVYTSAFKKGDSVVVVSVNMATSAKSVTFAIAGLKSSTGKKITTSGTKHMTDDGTVTVSGGNALVGNAATGDYKVYDLTGTLLGQVNHAEGQALDAEIRQVAAKPGLYFAKSVNGSESYKIAVEGFSK